MPHAFADAKTIFNALALEYDAYRPIYPRASIDFLVRLGHLDALSTVADIGTGTGRIALALAPHVRRLFAVDTANMMLEQLQENTRRERLTNILPIEAAGEKTGLPPQSLDLAVLSQVFHWMDKAMALREMHRILKPGRPMAIVWNQITSTDEPYHEAIERLIQKYNPNYRGGLDIISIDFPEAIAASGLFSTPETHSFPFSQQFAHESFIGYLLSKSYVGMGIPRSELPSFMQETHEILHSHFGLAKVTEQYRTIVLSATALED